MVRVLMVAAAGGAVLVGCVPDAQPIEDAVAGIEVPTSWEEQARTTEGGGLTGECSVVAGSDCPRVIVEFATPDDPVTARDLALDSLVAEGFVDHDPLGDCRGAFAGQERCTATIRGDGLQFVVVTATADDGRGSDVELRATFEQ